jgi:NAD(P)-dependent dehydrogenase (short-subunit alcohol dehydrogenase family)
VQRVLEGQVAVVTGAGRGIGRTEALLLARLGAAVVVNDLGTEWDGVGRSADPASAVVSEIRLAGGTAAANHCDITTWATAGELIDQAIDEFGRLDILVNNAGILRDRLVLNMNEADWDAVVRCHLYGHAATTHHACRHWQTARSGGRIINTTSEAGLYGLRGQANYAAAKAGIVALTLVTAAEMAPFGVTVNAIAPRARTRLITETFGDDAMAPTPGAFDSFAPENVAPLVAFLAAPEAEGITGRCFVVSGGVIELLEGWRVVQSVESDGPWQLEDVADRIGSLISTAAVV